MQPTADNLILHSENFTIDDYQQAIEDELDKAEQTTKDLRMSNRRNSQSVGGFAYLNVLTFQLIESYSRIIQRKISEQDQSNT